MLLLLALLSNVRTVDAIVGRNIFCSGCDQRSARPAPLALELLATMRCPADERWSMAVILSTTDRTSGMYAVGSFARGAEVVRIGARQVMLRIGDRMETLALDDRSTPTPAVAAVTPRGIACGGGHCDVGRPKSSRARRPIGPRGR